MKTKYDWSNVPKEVQWIATDADGVANGFAGKPEKYIGRYLDMWLLDGNSELYISIGLENSYKFGKLDWQDSLEERPND